MSDPRTPTNRLFALLQNQGQRREHLGHFRQMEMSELKAIAELGRKTFGSRGLLEAGPEEIGILYMGYYIDPKSVPSHRRRRKLLFRGCKVSEFEEQIRIWKTMSVVEQASLWVPGMPS